MEKWVSEKEDKIEELIKNGLTEKEIAAKMDMSSQQIKIKSKNLSLTSEGYLIWTEQNLKALKFLISKGEDNESIAKILGDNKTEEAVAKKRKDLGL